MWGLASADVLIKGNAAAWLVGQATFLTSWGDDDLIDPNRRQLMLGVVV